MRHRLRRSYLIVIIALILLAIFWTYLSHYNLSENVYLVSNSIKEKIKIDNYFEDHASNDYRKELSSQSALTRKKSVYKIDCMINSEYSIGCLKNWDDMIYIPFNFIHKYFDINGKLSKNEDGDEVFNWEHSYSKVYQPREKYNPRGPFLWFENYNVEVRDRVKCISGMYNVPISTQWDSKGHFYPIQISQYGLSHFSKHLINEKPRSLILEDGSFKQIHWQLAVKGNRVSIKSMQDEDVPSNKVLAIDGELITFKLKRKKLNNYDLILSLRVKPISNFNFTVTLQKDSKTQYTLSYNTNNYDSFGKKSFYGIGKGQVWRNITRDLGIDLIKSYSISNRKIKGLQSLKNLEVVKITFNGKAIVDDVMILSNAHESQFMSAAKWLIHNQDESGGWPIKVTRKLSNGALILHPGWYSAMGQGQAISLLTRMYHITQDRIYLDAAIKALSLFNIDSSEGGIRTYFTNTFVWYEEYPTTPSSFVLNGFIYSLFGLYDLKMSCAKECEEASKLFEEGFNSLKQLLPLFDTGSGTLYDLRHFSLKIAPNLARWDYHTTHINQLLYLNTLFKESVFKNTTKRWISYMKGYRAAHN